MQPRRLHSTSRLLALAIACVGALSLWAGAAHATAPTITSFSPTSGILGTDITVRGTGFTGTTAATIDGVNAAFHVNSNTSVTVTVPTSASTGRIAVTRAGGTGTSAKNFTVIPGVKLTPGSGRPLSNLTITGSGFTASRLVDVYFDTTDVVLAVSNPLGVVSTSIQVPASAQPGVHWVTLAVRGSGIAAQQSFVVSTDWPMWGFTAAGRGFNPYENTITPSTVAGLVNTWSIPVSSLGNPDPFIVYGGNVFVGNIEGAIHAYSSAGKLLWTASPGGSLESVTPAAYGGRVFFGGADGNVHGYRALCRTDGGVCAPTWTTSVGGAVTASLTVYQGKVYAPSDDGSIHVLDPVTGAPGTPLAVAGGSGPATTPVSFGADGASYYYGRGSTLLWILACCVGNSTYGGAVSPVAVTNRAGFLTSSDGMVHQFNGSGWNATMSGANCQSAPVIANNLVYAGSCTTLDAFNAGNGALVWSVTTSQAISGLSVAGGVLYACQTFAFVHGVVVAYNAANGARLWTGGTCAGPPPLVVNGMLFVTGDAELSAYELPGARESLAVPKPNPLKLRPDFRLRPGQPAKVSESEPE